MPVLILGMCVLATMAAVFGIFPAAMEVDKYSSAQPSMQRTAMGQAGGR